MMKKSIFFVSLLLFQFSTFAQEVFIGVKGGLNISNINNDPDNHAKFGLHAGAYGGYKFNDKMAGSIELLYTQKGTHHTGPINYSPVESQANGDVMVFIDYLDIPLLFHYYFTPQFNVHGGLTIGAPIRGVRSWRKPRYGNFSFINDIDKTVASFPLGVTYEIGSLNLGARADLGLTKIGNDQRKNMVFMLSIGYTFFKKGATIGAGKGTSKSTKKK